MKKISLPLKMLGLIAIFLFYAALQVNQAVTLLSEKEGVAVKSGKVPVVTTRANQHSNFKK
jgi:hypothetical protein